MAFDTNKITVPAGAKVTLVFTNNDKVPHNVAFYETSAAAKSIYVGEVFTGPKTVTYTFTAPSTPGTYFFRCDVHPSVMTGDFVVTAGP
jgi:plastocyanin